MKQSTSTKSLAEFDTFVIWNVRNSRDCHELLLLLEFLIEVASSSELECRAVAE